MARAPRPHRRWVTVLSLIVAVGALLVMLLVGAAQVLAPMHLPSPSSSSGGGCTGAVTYQRSVGRHEITVSVFNAGARPHFASTTLDRLERLGFRPGEVANSTADIHPRTAVVLTQSEETAPAELVARALGPDVRVQHGQEAYGPGIDVFIGPGQRGVHPRVPRRVPLHHPIKNCVDVG